jgi:hypothetical protein
VGEETAEILGLVAGVEAFVSFEGGAEDGALRGCCGGGGLGGLSGGGGGGGGGAGTRLGGIGRRLAMSLRE